MCSKYLFLCNAVLQNHMISWRLFLTRLSPIYTSADFRLSSVLNSATLLIPRAIQMLGCVQELCLDNSWVLECFWQRNHSRWFAIAFRKELRVFRKHFSVLPEKSRTRDFWHSSLVRCLLRHAHRAYSYLGVKFWYHSKSWLCSILCSMITECSMVFLFMWF